MCADVFRLPKEWERQFDFVWECRTIQALPLDVRKDVMGGIVSLLNPAGTLLVCTHYHRGNEPPSGPPWALSEDDLSYFLSLGLREKERAIDFLPDGKTEILLLEYIRFTH